MPRETIAAVKAQLAPPRAGGEEGQQPRAAAAPALPLPSAGPRNASTGERPAEQGLPPEPGAQAGAMLKTKMAAPGKGAQLRP